MMSGTSHAMQIPESMSCTAAFFQKWGTKKPYTMQPPRLNNFGATCYINSTIQTLYNCTNLTNALLTRKIAYPENTLADLYVKLIKHICMLPAPVTFNYQQTMQTFWQNQLLSFVNQAYTIMGGCGQMDATRFITELLNSLMEEDPAFQDPKYKNDPNLVKKEHPLGKLFTIGQASIVSCPSKNIKRTQITYETSLNVEVQDASSLHECLNKYFTTESIELDVNGSPPDCTKKLAISHLSDIVIVTLKRFTVNPFTGSLRKLSHSITVEPTISFNQYMMDPSAQTTPPTYELTGAIVQKGSLIEGHYIAYVKRNSQWYFCSDTHIGAVTWQNMKKNKLTIQGKEFTGYSVDQSYALIYQKQPKALVPSPDNGKPGVSTDNLVQALQQLTTALDGLYARLSV